MVPLQRAFAQLDLEDFEVIARLDVVGIGEHDTAFETRAHFGDIVLEAAERSDRRCRDNDVVAGEARVEPLADRTLEHEQACGLVALARREDVLDLGAADDILDAFRTQFARHLLRDVGGQVIDDVII